MFFRRILILTIFIALCPLKAVIVATYKDNEKVGIKTKEKAYGEILSYSWPQVLKGTKVSLSSAVSSSNSLKSKLAVFIKKKIDQNNEMTVLEIPTVLWELFIIKKYTTDSKFASKIRKPKYSLTAEDYFTLSREFINVLGEHKKLSGLRSLLRDFIRETAGSMGSKIGGQKRFLEDILKIELDAIDKSQVVLYRATEGYTFIYDTKDKVTPVYGPLLKAQSKFNQSREGKEFYKKYKAPFNYEDPKSIINLLEFVNAVIGKDNPLSHYLVLELLRAFYSAQSFRVLDFPYINFNLATINSQKDLPVQTRSLEFSYSVFEKFLTDTTTSGSVECPFNKYTGQNKFFYAIVTDLNDALKSHNRVFYLPQTNLLETVFIAAGNDSPKTFAYMDADQKVGWNLNHSNSKGYVAGGTYKILDHFKAFLKRIFSKGPQKVMSPNATKLATLFSNLLEVNSFLEKGTIIALHESKKNAEAILKNQKNISIELKKWLSAKLES